MIRKQFYISAEQDARLKRLAKEQGLTEAEVVRMAIDRLSDVNYSSDETTAGAVREVALMDRYVADHEGGRAEEAKMYARDAREAWAEELKFMRSIGSKAKSDDDNATAWKFNREELYEERLNKILRRQ